MRRPIAVGWVSSEYGKRGGGFHAGIDLRAASGYDTQVFAAFAGTVERTVATRVHDRNPAQPLNANKPSLASGRTGNGVIVRNPDGEQQLYGHVAPMVRVGQKVVEGQLLGTIDNSGNTSGPHVHYEEWTVSTSTRNPRLSFQRFGISYGNRAIAAAPVRVPALSQAVRKKLTDMELPPTATGVRQYQRAHGLFVDGDWSTVTERYYQWVRSLQEYLNTCDDVRPPVRVDGDRGPKTKAAEKQAKRAATDDRPYRPPAEPPKLA